MIQLSEVSTLANDDATMLVDDFKSLAACAHSADQTLGRTHTTPSANSHRNTPTPSDCRPVDCVAIRVFPKEPGDDDRFGEEFPTLGRVEIRTPFDGDSPVPDSATIHELGSKLQHPIKGTKELWLWYECPARDPEHILGSIHKICSLFCDLRVLWLRVPSPEFIFPLVPQLLSDLVYDALPELDTVFFEVVQCRCCSPATMTRERLRELKSRAELGEATKRTGRKSSLKELIFLKPSVASGLGQKLERALPIGVDIQTVENAKVNMKGKAPHEVKQEAFHLAAILIQHFGDHVDSIHVFLDDGAISLEVTDCPVNIQPGLTVEENNTGSELPVPCEVPPFEKIVDFTSTCYATTAFGDSLRGRDIHLATHKHDTIDEKQDAMQDESELAENDSGVPKMLEIHPVDERHLSGPTGPSKAQPKTLLERIGPAPVSHHDPIPPPAETEQNGSRRRSGGKRRRRRKRFSRTDEQWVIESDTASAAAAGGGYRSAQGPGGDGRPTAAVLSAITGRATKAIGP
ncbi:hypothetical protein C8Q74DRAFT_1222928 [Fomes fomentarius]|nr:hypothetical protein C8Q74DRAFT_1222928 [Fomes fomentarius]